MPTRPPITVELMEAAEQEAGEQQVDYQRRGCNAQDDTVPWERGEVLVDGREMGEEGRLARGGGGPQW